MAQIIQNSKSLLLDSKDTHTQGVYMPAVVLTIFLPRNAALSAMSLLVPWCGKSLALLLPESDSVDVGA